MISVVKENEPSDWLNSDRVIGCNKIEIYFSRSRSEMRREEMKLIFSLIFMAAGVVLIFVGYYKGWWN